jgi:AraC-like DNA-binding protein
LNALFKIPSEKCQITLKKNIYICELQIYKMFSYKDLIYIILIIETILFAFQLITFKNSPSQSNKILGILMLFFTAYFSIIFLYNRGLYDYAIYGQYFIMPVFLSITPFYYIYIQSNTTENYRFTKKSLLHYTPAFLILLFNLIFYSFLTGNEKLLLVSKGLKGGTSGGSMLKLNLMIELVSLGIYYIQLISYVIGMIFLLKKHSQNIKNYFSYQQNISLNWLKIFVTFIMINALLEIFIAFTSFSGLFSHLELIYYCFIIFLISFLGLFGIKQTDIYTGNIKEKITLSDKITFTGQENFLSNDANIEVKTNTPHVSEDDQVILAGRIIELIEKNKLYLNNKLSVYDIANDLETNISYISLTINNQFKKNFRNFINEYRVAEAIRLLTNSQYNNLSIEGIAQNSGFVSMSTFRSSFLKITQKNPSDFRKLS